MPTTKTIIAMKLSPRIVEALDVARKAQEIKPDRSQAALHFFCKGLGIAADEEPTAPVAGNHKRKK